ncbi:MAG: hypothetical protein G01um101429_159 [Parcubacteria group bacterium Gr01-1014_29]|nr:MAG: hypothetical protein G01um101429_159 [Parcubacteria group bacterium Gr01-1014_29]
MTIRGREIKRSHILIGSAVLVGIAIILFFLLRGGDTTGGSAGEDDGSFFGFLFGGSSVSPKPLDNTATGDDTEQPEQYLFRITNEPVAGATISSDGTSLRYFKKTTGHLFENSFTGDKEQRISNITTLAILNAQWTPSKEYAIISYYTNGAVRRFYSHYSGTSTITSAVLPNDIIDITTSKTDEKIAYLVSSGAETMLLTANPDNTGIKNVFSTPFPDFELSWPVTNRIGLKTRSSAYAPSVLYTLNPSTKQLTRVLDEKEGLDVLWSPDGTGFLSMKTSREGTNVALRVVSLQDNTAVDFPFVTLPEKCVWAPSKERVLYCAIPQQIPSGTHVPDEWWQGSVSFDDALWRIYVDTGIRQQLLSAYQLDAINLFTDKEESFLFFSNKKDGLLWSLRLR